MTVSNQPPANPAAPDADPINTALRDVNYQSVDEWKEATHAARGRLRQQQEQLQALQAQLEEVQRRMLPSEARQQRDSAADLATYVPMDALDAYVNDRIQRSIDGTIGPLVKTNAALTRVKAAIPDFARFEPEWQQWLAANPDLNRRFQEGLLKAPDEADLTIAGAYKLFETERRASAPEPKPPTVPNSATLPSTQGSGSARGQDVGGPSPEEMQATVKAASAGNVRAKIQLMKWRGIMHPELPPQP